EITTTAKLDYGDIVRDTVRSIGYVDSAMGFDARSCAVLTAIERQSPDIAQGVEQKEQGAGDQGLMFGFACNETPELMPLPISLAHRLMEYLAKVRKENKYDFLRPDAKSQVTVRYVGGEPVGVDAVVISTQHTPEVSNETLRQAMIEEVIKKVIPSQYLHKSTAYHINPTGRFVIGGPQGDCGLTGRTIIVDTYGGYGRHGGGAFSGKDPSKVDRSACYMARYVAKNVVAAGLAKRCEIQVAYAIGVAEPVSLLVDTFDTGQVPEHKLSSVLRELFDFRPAGIIKTLELKRPIYQPTAAYGHFGRIPKDGLFTWERTDMVDALRSAFGMKAAH
ncbi:MAG TPA: methionine adenosyltransferase, partial [Candidatus Binataceae bacterium]|nr:methionine adenosyltransferase [Candidatus Binataceae bacterium]